MDVDLLDGVGQAVDHHVEPRAEQVLMPGRAETGGDLGRVGVVLTAVARRE
jgi:hypothetical protein